MVNYKCMVLTRPYDANDVTLRVFHVYFTGPVLNESSIQGFTCVDIESRAPGASKNEVTRSKLEGALSKYDPVFYCNFGHGEYDCIHGTENCIVDLSNASVLAGRVTYAYSCKTRKTLGPEVIKRGGIAYIGYDEELRQVIEWFGPVAVPVAGFKETAILCPKLLFQGKTVDEACKATIDEYNKWIDYWKDKDPTVYSVLVWDRDHFGYLGDGTAKVTESKLTVYLRTMTASATNLTVALIICALLVSFVRSLIRAKLS